MTDPAFPPVSAEDVRRWVDEDVGDGDLTTIALIPEQARCTAAILVKASGVVAGLEPVRAVFHALDPEIEWQQLRHDGDRIEPGPVARVRGRARSILSGERLALNLLGRLSGVATLSRRYVDAVEGTGMTVLDTRKTTPGLRMLEKAAVRAGGATNHRLSLNDAILIKDNHLRFAASVGDAIRMARRAGVPVIVECDTIAQVRDAIEARPDRILLDNMSLAQLSECVALVGHRIPLEASGGVTLATIRAIAETGVEFASSGALTTQAVSLDVSLEVEDWTA